MDINEGNLNILFTHLVTSWYFGLEIQKKWYNNYYIKNKQTYYFIWMSLRIDSGSFFLSHIYLN